MRCKNRIPGYDIAEWPGALALIDLDMGRTLTNDVEAVLVDLKKIYPRLSELKIMYRDTNGIYDGIDHDNGTFLRFFSINETDGNEAYNKLMRWALPGKNIIKLK